MAFFGTSAGAIRLQPGSYGTGVDFGKALYEAVGTAEGIGQYQTAGRLSPDSMELPPTRKSVDFR
jgi:hypothetical protein